MVKRVYLSPSNQTANTYSYGNTTEAVQCGRIAEYCRKALLRSSVEVMVSVISIYINTKRRRRNGRDKKKN